MNLKVLVILCSDNFSSLCVTNFTFLSLRCCKLLSVVFKMKSSVNVHFETYKSGTPVCVDATFPGLRQRHTEARWLTDHFKFAFTPHSLTHAHSQRNKHKTFVITCPVTQPAFRPSFCSCARLSINHSTCLHLAIYSNPLWTQSLCTYKYISPSANSSIHQ